MGARRLQGFGLTPRLLNTVALPLLGTHLSPRPADPALNFTVHENRFRCKAQGFLLPGPEAHRRRISRHRPVTRIPGSNLDTQTCARSRPAGTGGRGRPGRTRLRRDGSGGGPGQGLSPQRALLRPWRMMAARGSFSATASRVRLGVPGRAGSRSLGTPRVR